MTISLNLFLPMIVHLAGCVVLYAALTVVRAPAVWGVASNSPVARRFERIEPRISANLSNQFEWPLFFHVGCLLLMLQGEAGAPSTQVLAWTFIVGRLLHSAVQILVDNVRLRGLVFTINFLAVLGLWGQVLMRALEAAG